MYDADSDDYESDDDFDIDIILEHLFGSMGGFFSFFHGQNPRFRSRERM